MDWLNKSWSEWSERFGRLPASARLLAAGVVLAAMTSLVYFASRGASSEDVYLLGGQGFSSSEMAAMEAAFGRSKLGGYRIESNRIRVPAGQQAAYMAALADHGALPANFGDYLAEANVKVGPFTSRTQQEELLKAAKQRELALIICSMQGIERAAVHYDTQKKGGLRSAIVTTASVSVKPLGSQPLDEKQVPMIRHLVAGAIAGLAPEGVTVIDLNGRTYTGGTAGSPGAAQDDPYLARVKQYQSLYETTIGHALSYVGGATISVHVELDRELVHRTERQPTTWSAERTQVDLAALTPKIVTASVGVPSSYYENIWRRRTEAALGTSTSVTLDAVEREESEKIRVHVGRLLPHGPAQANASQPPVTVTTFAQIPAADMLRPSWYEPPAPANALPWTTMVLVALAVAAAWKVRSLMTSKPEEAAEPAEVSNAQRRLDAAVDDIPKPHIRRPVPQGATLREELAEIVRDDPEAAVNVLRGWISHGR
jgi:flagellar M-ring protein FliF